MSIRLAIAAVLLIASAQPATPHSGGTNADGCHTNRRTGDYHCHTPKAPVYGAVTYCHVLRGERRCGYSRGSCDDLVSEYGGYCQRE